MNKLFFFISIFLVLTSSFPVCAQNDPLIIYYLGNEGFLLHNGENKIIIDALFTNGWGKYHVPSTKTLSSIENSINPFNKINFMLISHDNPDHYSKSLVSSFLSKNKEIKVLTSNTIKTQLADLSPFINIETPTSYMRVLNKLDNSYLEVIMNNLQHADDSSNKIDNVCFVLKFNGYTLFFPGDGSSNNIELYKKMNLSDYKINILFAPKWYFTKEYGTSGFEIINYINPQYIIGMHIENNMYDSYKEIAKTTLKKYSVLFFDKELSGASFKNDKGKFSNTIF